MDTLKRLFAPSASAVTLQPSSRATMGPSSAAAADSAKKPARPWVKMAIGGSVTVFFETFAFGHFLEMLKIQKQTAGSAESYVSIMRRLTATKGLSGTLDGFLPWGLVQCMAKGAVFSYGQAASYKALHGNSVMSQKSTEVLSGGLGGALQGIVMSPLLLLKTRVITDPAFRATGGVVDTALASARVGGAIVAREGAVGLMKGSGTFAAKRFADWTSRFFFVMVMEDLMRATPESSLSGKQQVAAALLGGTVSALVTIPIDVLVATIQQAGNAGQKVSLAQTMRQQGGFKNVVAFSTRGLVARVSHVAMTTLLMKTVSKEVYDRFFR